MWNTIKYAFTVGVVTTCLNLMTGSNIKPTSVYIDPNRFNKKN